jgi:cysteine desulfurase
MKTVYLDNNATTAVAPEVRAAMEPYFNELFGNPSSLYDLSRPSKEAVADAREKVAKLLNCDPDEVLFTSCGTESDNAAIIGTLWANPEKKHIITTAVEHHAIGYVGEALEKHGYDVTYLPVDENGMLDIDQFKKSLRKDTAIVSVMWANNETGVIFPVEELAQLCKERGIIFHTDAVQAAGKIPLNMKDSAIDMLSISGHKLHTPKGIGILYLRKDIKWEPFMKGGQQEKGKRPGTENVPYIVGMGKAAELALSNMDEEYAYLTQLRDYMQSEILRRIPDVRVTAATSPRLPNTLHICFKGAKDDAMLHLLNTYGIAASSGSACNTESTDISHVLRAMHIPEDYILGSLRLSLSRYTTREDIDYLLEKLPAVVERTRKARSKRKATLQADK